MEGSSQINSHACRGIWFILEQRMIQWELAPNAEKLCEPPRHKLTLTGTYLQEFDQHISTQLL